MRRGRRAPRAARAGAARSPPASRRSRSTRGRPQPLDADVLGDATGERGRRRVPARAHLRGPDGAADGRRGARAARSPPLAELLDELAWPDPRPTCAGRDGRRPAVADRGGRRRGRPRRGAPARPGGAGGRRRARHDQRRAAVDRPRSAAVGHEPVVVLNRFDPTTTCTGGTPRGCRAQRRAPCSLRSGRARRRASPAALTRPGMPHTLRSRDYCCDCVTNQTPPGGPPCPSPPRSCTVPPRTRRRAVALLAMVLLAVALAGCMPDDARTFLDRTNSLRRSPRAWPRSGERHPHREGRGLGAAHGGHGSSRALHPERRARQPQLDGAGREHRLLSARPRNTLLTIHNTFVSSRRPPREPGQPTFTHMGVGRGARTGTGASGSPRCSPASSRGVDGAT